MAYDGDILADTFPQVAYPPLPYSYMEWITMDKMGITLGQHTMCLEMLQQMSCATSQEGYWASYSAQKQENKIV